MIRLVPILFVLLVWTNPTLAQTKSPDPLTITTDDGVHTFSVELALTGREQARGLMYRDYLGEQQGMLFVYRRLQNVTMWMKNTFIPLDMIFINDDGSIARIHERAVPHSEAVIPSGGRVRAVLEVRGGTADRLGLEPGDRVEHPALNRF